MSTLDKAPSNSDKARATTPPAKTEQRTDPTVVRRKQNIFKRAANSLVDGATKNGKLDLKNGIIRPAIDNVIMQTVSTIAGSIVGAFETAIFGTSSRGKSWGSYRYGSEYDYNARYRTGSESRVTIIRNGETEIRDRNAGYSPRAREMHAFDEIFFKDPDYPGGKSAMEKAKEALDQLLDLKENYPIVRVSDFYSACQVSSSPQDREWGWRDLTGAAPRRVMGGVVIDMPKPEYIGL